ncbi:LrgB family protein [Salinicola corii]|uniref:LrgB family protein n=1 Tax=Salinicola corii TaxID=2606937 RepID=A0A640WAM3_9GAMM|nr:LrgB family protein [Salinicola corii]KAA0015671.1 LrgB family protein [Salinicola corii]
MNDWLERLSQLPQQWFDSPIAAIALTLGAYFFGIRLFKLMHRPTWCPPMLIAAILIAVTIALLPIGIDDYNRGAGWLMLLLGPATVALAVPLYQQLPQIRALWKPILLTLPLSATLAACYAVIIAATMGAPKEVLASLAPKSVTSPIALGLAEELGGSRALLMGALLTTGVTAIFGVEWLSRVLRIRDPRLIGLALGINGHALGTVRAFEISSAAGAFASLGMSLTGAFTAVVLPLVWHLFY